MYLICTCTLHVPKNKGVRLDLVPMENLWSILKKMVGERLPESVPELRNYSYEEWENLSNE